MTGSFEYPDFVARFYDVIYKKVRAEVDTGYFINKILATKGKVLKTKEQIAFLNNVHDHLNDKGIFTFDLFVPDPELMAEGIDNLTDFEGEYEPGKKVRRTVSSRTDIVNQLLDVTMKFAWDEDNKQIEKEWNLKMRLFFRYELEYLVRLSRLTLVNIFGDYNENPLNAGSKEFVIVCRK